MLGEYYDLVAGLPLISLQGGKDLPDYAVLISHLETLLSPADRNALRTLRLPYDNSNVATLLLGLPRPFDSRGNWSEEALKKELEKPDEVPPYLAEFISSRGEGGESRLDALFYEWIVTYPSQWIVSWFSFELHMRGFLAVLMRRKYNSVGGALEMPDIDELVPRIKTSSASDCGLSQALPWVPQLLAAFEEGPLEMELAADRIRWEVAGDLSALNYFGAEALFTFTVRLALASRWAKLDSSSSRERLERLVESLQVTVPE